MLLKQINRIVLGSCCLLLLMPFSVSAEDTPDEKGEMDWKVDRIKQDNSTNENSGGETELEQEFPELFKEETRATIESVQKEKKESLEETEKALFTINPEKNTTIADTKESLFTSDYVVPETSTDQQQEDEGGSSWFNNALMAGLTGLACVIGAAVYTMIQRFGG
ncbi:type VII secretion protein EssA [Lentibacillus sp. CBA3610]|uniref:type VII secretion protein EssA n=1 Tax=Lentibacillus sp. CBA3610 TaxID=2518176 RepID=UPI00159554B9|nr:type VII secretion protein EssA [Lentibacillus sp. CBA3610]QKY69805.1 type VII secretion protein EssA [Lentibacillus sp. CBA3610]